MRRFESSRVSTINAKEEVDQLKINDVGQLDAFEDELRHTTYLSEFKTLLTYIEYAANGGLLPDVKMKNITPDKETVKEFEFKSKHLRVYAIQLPAKKMIVLGGLKTGQKKDIPRFREIKKHYLESIKTMSS